MGTSSEGKYFEIWRTYLPAIVRAILSNEPIQTIQLDKQKFEKAGERKRFAFNLEFKSGIVCNNISGSAVARDLETIISRSEHTKKLISNTHFKFSMNANYILTIQKDF